MTFLSTIDGHLLKEMILSGVLLLEKNKQAIDALNVFPVPDGDTGTNMSLTMMSAAKELHKVDSASAGAMAAVVARGALMGARGNSGVILSQLYRGFSHALDGVEVIDTKAFAAALTSGSEAAYKAVMKPKEGTILTVARVIAEQATAYAQKNGDLYGLLENMVIWGEDILKKTTDMLPVLKQAGVVDAGGQGLLTIYRGYKAAIDGENLDEIGAILQLEEKAPEQFEHAHGETDIEFGYCTEFLIQPVKEGVGQAHIDRLREKLSQIGDCVLVVGDPTLVKVHVHTDNPGKALQNALKLGELTSIKIDNMRQQHRHLVMDEALVSDTMHAQAQQSYDKPYGIVSVCAGSGIAALMRDLGAQEIVEGGQTMNPSTEDILAAARRTGAKEVYILPNNSNIVLAAEQAAKLSEKQTIHVIPTKTVPQGIAALVPFMPDAPGEDNIARMTEAALAVRSGSVTYAVRDSQLDGREIHKDDVMGMSEGKLVSLGTDADAVAIDLLVAMADGGAETITVLYGDQVTEDRAKNVVEQISQLLPDCDVELVAGGQPLYYYLLSVE